MRISLLFMLLLLGGCSVFLDATHKGQVSQDYGERTWGSALDDSSIESVATVNIDAASKDFSRARVEVVSYNRVVLLVGQVQTDMLRQLAADTAEKLKDVRQVNNELAVRRPISFGVRSHDAWITTKVKSKLLFAKGVPNDNIKVITENGVVYLMGLVTTQQGNRAVETIRTTAGVQKIVKVFEYIDTMGN